MRKLFVITLLLIGGTMMAQQASFGIKGGLNYGSAGEYNSMVEGVQDLPSSIDGENKTGFHLGVYTKLGILGIFLQPELVYTQLNTQYSTFDYKINKIDAPVLLGFGIIGPLHIKAGPSFQYILSNELENTNLEIGEAENDISVGYQLGAGLNIGRLGFDVRYEGAFTENTAFSKEASENFSIDSRPSQWILSASYSFN